jgi:hypothetical protein
MSIASDSVAIFSSKSLMHILFVLMRLLRRSSSMTCFLLFRNYPPKTLHPPLLVQSGM